MRAESIHILRFHAGLSDCGVAAAAVRGFRAPGATTPHVAQLLGTTPDAAGAATRRDLLLASGDRLRPMTVDGPVQLVQLESRELLSTPRALAPTIAPVMGFAQLKNEPRLVLLLDTDRLVTQLDSLAPKPEDTTT